MYHSNFVFKSFSVLYYYMFFILTLRALSLFFKLLPISNTGISAADILATVSFLYPKLGHFSDRVLLLATCLLGRESPHALHRTISNTFFSLIWLQLRQTKQPHCMLAPATPTISGFPARKMTQLPTRLRGQGHWIPQLRRQRGDTAPFQSPLTGDTPL